MNLPPVDPDPNCTTTVCGSCGNVARTYASVHVAAISASDAQRGHLRICPGPPEPQEPTT